MTVGPISLFDRLNLVFQLWHPIKNQIFCIGLDDQILGRLSGRLAQAQFDLFSSSPLFPAINLNGTFTLTR